MKKLFKFIAILVVGLVVLIGAAALLVPKFVDPNDHKDRIAALVKEHTGRDLNLKGDIKLSVFPWVALDLGAVEISNPPGFDGMFAQTEKASIRVKVMPLLSKKVEMDTVQLSGLAVNLIRKADGTTNFDDLVQPKSTDGNEAKEDAATSGDGPAIAGLAIGGLDISNSSFTWTDAQAGQNYALTNLSAKTGTVELGKPVDLDVAFDLEGGPPVVKGNVVLGGRLNADVEGKRYEVENLSLTTDLAGDAVGGGKLSASVAGAMLADLAAQTASVTGLKFDLKTDGAGVPGSSITAVLVGDVKTDLAAQKTSISGLKLDVDASGAAGKGSTIKATLVGEVLANMAEQKASIQGLKLNVDASGAAGEGSTVTAALVGDVFADTGAQSATVNGLALDIDAKGGTIPGDGVKARVTGDVAADMASQVATISKLTLTALDLNASGDIKLEKFKESPTYSGKLQVAQFNPRALMKALGLPPLDTADESALTAMAMSFGLRGTTNSVSLEPLKLTMDQTNINGRFGVADFAKAALRFDIDVDSIDADRYLPPVAAQATQPASTPAGAAGQAAAFPLDTLRALDIDGKAKVGKLKISKLNSSNVRATVKAKNGSVKLGPLAANLYEGTYSGNINLDATGSQAKLAVNEVFKGIQAGTLMEDLQGKEGKILGKTDLSAKLTASGADVNGMKQTLGGKVRFDFRNGAIKGFNLLHMIREAKAKITGQTVSSDGVANQTDFSELGGTINFKDGVANNPDLAVKSPFFRVKGAGTANLVTEAIDYRTTASIVATSKGQGGKEINDLAGIDIPLKVGGTFASPTYGLDIEGLARSLAESKAKDLLKGKTDKVVETAKEKVQEKVTEALGEEAAKKLGGDKVKDAVGGALKGLFK
ncbi:MAG: AsmA family protein [Gammaproteobacteria bacterium]|nr:AsmA family protein [Gammaproteobacteria bacterium]